MSRSQYPDEISHNTYTFVIPNMIHPNIGTIKMKDLVHLFRAELLVFDLEKHTGVVFNLPDILQCSMLGICGVTNSFKDCLQLIDSSINLIKGLVTTREQKSIILDARSDLIDLNETISKLKMFIKSYVKDKMT